MASVEHHPIICSSSLTFTSMLNMTLSPSLNNSILLYFEYIDTRFSRYSWGCDIWPTARIFRPLFSISSNSTHLAHWPNSEYPRMKTIDLVALTKFARILYPLHSTSVWRCRKGCIWRANQSLSIFILDRPTILLRSSIRSKTKRRSKNTVLNKSV